MKIGIDVPRIERGVKSAKFGTVSETLFGLGHEREEIGQVAVVEGLSQLGQNELPQPGDFGDDEAGAITPIKLADGDGVGGDGFVSGRCG